MDKITLIIGLASLGYILIGLFVSKNKAANKSVENKEYEIKNKKFVKDTARANIVTGVLGLIVAAVNFFAKPNHIMIIIIFIVIVSGSSLVQMGIGKSYTNSLQK